MKDLDLLSAPILVKYVVTVGSNVRQGTERVLYLLGMLFFKNKYGRIEPLHDHAPSSLLELRSYMLGSEPFFSKSSFVHL